MMNKECFINNFSDEYVMDALNYIPNYDESIRDRNKTERLIALTDIYKVYLASKMSEEIYIRFLTAINMALEKKENALIYEQQRINFEVSQTGVAKSGIIGGCDSFTLIAESGVGKSSAIARAVNLITGGKIIKTTKPLSKVIPCVIVQCPFDCSAKGLLLEILRVIDSYIGTNYYSSSQRASVTTDVLIGTVSAVCINHIALLVIDEIQNVVCHKGGMNLVNMLTQLINNSGISICMVGVPECIPFFEQSLRLARRSIGLRYDTMLLDDYFVRLCKLLFSFQYVKVKTEISDMIIEWLYMHSRGIISLVVSLIHDAQEIAILSGSEILNLETLEKAYIKNMRLVHCYTLSKPIKLNRKRCDSNPIINRSTIDESAAYERIPFTVKHAKDNGLDVVRELRRQITVDEVYI